MLRSKRISTSSRVRAAIPVAALGLAALLGGCSAGAAPDGDAPTDAGAAGDGLTVGLIIKTESNPFWVTIRDAAKAKAEQEGVELISLAGDFDGDTDGHAAAIENLIAQDVDAIVITPNHSTALNALLQQARDAGILTIALDTATDPLDAVDATIATDNYAGGIVLGEWAAASLAGADPVVATLDGVPGQEVADQRHDGFIEGFGIADDEIVARQNTDGSQDKGQSAAENVLQANAGITTMFAMNEPVARGAAVAMEQLGRTGVTVATFDGQCQGVEDVRDGRISATILQFPSRMAEIAIDAVVTWSETGEKPESSIDSGSALVTDHPVEGIDSLTSEKALAECWG